MLGLNTKEFLVQFPDVDRVVELESGKWVNLRPWPSAPKKSKPSFRNPEGTTRSYPPATQEEYKELLKNPGWKRYIGELPEHVAQAYAKMGNKSQGQSQKPE